jgi:RNA polymerase sigma-70 factor (ECF subfamily)
MELEVTQLMMAVKAGDVEAFDALVTMLRSRAFHVAHSLVGSREDAMDMTQEAFLKTFRARGTFRDGEPFLPWFHQILRNTCFSFLRKHRRLVRHSISGDRSEEEGDWELEGDDPPPARGAEHGELHGVFWKAFHRLSERDREILALRHFQGLAYKEIAHALSIPEGTVMSRLFHARRHLRDHLDPHLEGALCGLGLADGGPIETTTGREHRDRGDTG